jgi:hypothetical protein
MKADPSCISTANLKDPISVSRKWYTVAVVWNLLVSFVLLFKHSPGLIWVPNV